VQAGGAFAYTATVTNGGSREAAGLTLTIVLDGDWRWAPRGRRLGLRRRGDDHLHAGVAGGVVVELGGRDRDRAGHAGHGRVDGDGGRGRAEDGNGANDSDTETTTVVGGDADVSVTTRRQPRPGEAGATSHLRHRGGQRRPGAGRVGDAGPRALERRLVSLAGDGWTCVSSSCTRSGLGRARARRLMATVTAPATAGTVTATATVGAASDDPDPTDDVGGGDDDGDRLRDRRRVRSGPDSARRASACRAAAPA